LTVIPAKAGVQAEGASDTPSPSNYIASFQRKLESTPSRHSSESWNPSCSSFRNWSVRVRRARSSWIPAFAGMTLTG